MIFFAASLHLALAALAALSAAAWAFLRAPGALDGMGVWVFAVAGASLAGAGFACAVLGLAGGRMPLWRSLVLAMLHIGLIAAPMVVLWEDGVQLWAKWQEIRKLKNPLPPPPHRPVPSEVDPGG